MISSIKEKGFFPFRRCFLDSPSVSVWITFNSYFDLLRYYLFIILIYIYIFCLFVLILIIVINRVMKTIITIIMSTIIITITTMISIMMPTIIILPQLNATSIFYSLFFLFPSFFYSFPSFFFLFSKQIFGRRIQGNHARGHYS